MQVGRNEKCPCGSGSKYKKCCMVRNSRKVHETLKHFFGEEWIEAEMNKVELEGYHNTNPMNLARMDWHPLIRAIVGTQIKMARAKEAQSSIALGKDELIQEYLHHNLNALEPKLDIEDVRRRLRDKTEFPKVEYEIAIAAGYDRMGYKVEFIPRTTARTGEFYVTDIDGNKVLIECKKKDKISPKEEKIASWWEEFQHLVMQKLKASKKSYGVAIYLPFDPVRDETHKVADEVGKLIAADHDGEIEVLAGKFKLKFQRNLTRESSEAFAKDASLGVGRAMVNPKTGEATEVVEVRAYHPSDFIDEKVESIIATLGQAYGQLEEDKPNIVYIDINIAAMTPERSKAVMERLPLEIEKKLNRDYTKISAVVITDVKPLNYSEAMGIHADEVVIINPRAKMPMPTAFGIYGDKRGGQSILADLHKLLRHT